MARRSVCYCYSSAGSKDMNFIIDRTLLHLLMQCPIEFHVLNLNTHGGDSIASSTYQLFPNRRYDSKNLNDKTIWCDHSTDSTIL